jgi:tetratricopeptide (TPR) repeat protein
VKLQKAREEHTAVVKEIIDMKADYLHSKIGNTKEAISIIEGLIKTDPNYLGAYYKLGALYESKSKMDKAMRIYRIGIKLATEKNDNKAKGELEEALWLIEEE